MNEQAPKFNRTMDDSTGGIIKKQENSTEVNSFCEKTTEKIKKYSEFASPEYKHATLINPKDIDYQKLSEVNKEKTNPGDCYVNSETLNADFEATVPFIVPNKEEWKGKRNSEVFNEIIKEYGDKYNIPGIEYLQWVYENPDKNKITTQMEGGNRNDGLQDYYITLGTPVVDKNGSWVVNSIMIKGPIKNSTFIYTVSLDENWNSNDGDRVILLEKSKDINNPIDDTQKINLSLKEKELAFRARTGGRKIYNVMFEDPEKKKEQYGAIYKDGMYSINNRKISKLIEEYFWQEPELFSSVMSFSKLAEANAPVIALKNDFEKIESSKSLPGEDISFIVEFLKKNYRKIFEKMDKSKGR